MMENHASADNSWESVFLSLNKFFLQTQQTEFSAERIPEDSNFDFNIEECYL